MATEDTELDAVSALVQSDGWAHFRAAVLKEIADSFEANITKALDVPDATMAIDRMRQVAAVRAAGLRWLNWPTERLRVLKQPHGVDPLNQSRRGDL